MLIDHLRKGDPVDIGNFAMMLHQRGENIVTDILPGWLCAFVQPQRAAVPEGFRLVPIKPPEEILKAMMRAIEDRELYDQQLRHAAINCWDAMLAAAPDREG